MTAALIVVVVILAVVVLVLAVPRLRRRTRSGPAPSPSSDRRILLPFVAEGLSVRTVETHRAHIQQKLRLATRSDLVRYALEHDLLGAEV